MTSVNVVSKHMLVGSLLVGCAMAGCQRPAPPGRPPETTSAEAARPADPRAGACTPQADSALHDLIRVTRPQPQARVESPLRVTGQARGTWYFEADFPVQLLAADGAVVAHGIAQAKGEWMTEAFVPFEARLEFASPRTDEGRLVLHRDNPSDLRQHDAALCVPVRF